MEEGRKNEGGKERWRKEGRKKGGTEEWWREGKKGESEREGGKTGNEAGREERVKRKEGRRETRQCLFLFPWVQYGQERFRLPDFCRESP